jgi:predicted Rossmann fold flavoprotein
MADPDLMGKRKVLVIGGGASGLMAAGRAAECGAQVTLLEKMATPARKIRITGKGRCNLSNSAEISDFIAHFGPSGRFLRQSFGTFFSAELITFLESRGLQVGFERGGRIFPLEGDAPAVARLLVDWVKEVGVSLVTSAQVTDLLVTDDKVTGVISDGKKLYADSVILATGGRSYPRTGSTGDGYRLAESMGHTVVPTSPALVSLKTDKKAVRGFAGLTLKNVKARLFVEGKRKQQEFGDLSFSGSGLGGPIILTLSPVAVDGLRAGKNVVISLDLKPALDDQKLEARLLRDLKMRTREPMSSVLRGLLPMEMVDACLMKTSIDPDLEAGQLPAAARTKLRLWLKDFRFDINGYGSWNEAIITSGGVRTAEINPKTMESKKISELYIIGELLDIQADTGGYNLQAAFSTGWVAGQAAAGRV